MPSATSDESPPASVGLLIQRARQRKKLTQPQLAELIGVSTTSVANWEIGKHYPIRYAGAIEEVLDITIPAPEPDEVPA